MSPLARLQNKSTNMERNNMYARFLMLLWFSVYLVQPIKSQLGDPYTWINEITTNCETEALRVGSSLADHFNKYDEGTEWDCRLHSDYLTERLAFSPWIQLGTWGSHGVSTEHHNAKELHKKGGWAGMSNISASSYWALEDQWLYMMGDSTTRQVWATYVSPFQTNDFERNAKEWTREHCTRQFPRRKAHPAGDYFPEEGWGGKCGNNEVTCDLSGYGKNGIITFDWKHFTLEDYDEWLFGAEGRWSLNSTRRPDILAIQIGLHTCVHGVGNSSMIKKHEDDIPLFMALVNESIHRPFEVLENNPQGKSMVIFVLAGRSGNPGVEYDRCTWRFNRLVAKWAHKFGFAVLEREEIERRFLFKSEYAEVKNTKFALHLDHPGPQIVGTALLTLITCLRRHGAPPRVNDTY